jgi:hypothetical protein
MSNTNNNNNNKRITKNIILGDSPPLGTPPTTTFTQNTLLFEISDTPTPTGNVYQFVNGQWAQFSGPAKTETLVNKTITDPIISRILNTGGAIITLPTTTTTVIGANTTDTFTNKTINVNSNTITATSQAVGDLMYNDGTKFTRLGRGTSGQVLTTTSSSIGWAAATGGGGGGGSTAMTTINPTFTIYQDATNYIVRNNWDGSTTTYAKTADFATALEFAINSIATTGTGGDTLMGGSVFIAKGVYTVKSQVDITFTLASRHGIEVYGEGPGTKIAISPASALTNGFFIEMNGPTLHDMRIVANSNVTNIITLHGAKDPGGRRDDYYKLVNLWIEGPNADGGTITGAFITGQIGIHVDGNTNTGTTPSIYFGLIDKCNLTLLDKGIRLNGSECTSCQITGCRFLDCDIGIDIINGSAQHEILNNWIQGDLTVGSSGVHLSGTANINLIDNLNAELHKTGVASQAILIDSGAANNRIGTKIANAWAGTDPLFKVIADNSGNLTNASEQNINAFGSNYIVNKDNVTYFNATFQQFHNQGLLFADATASFNYIFDASGALTGSRLISLPILASNDTFVFQAHTQTLTNKTIDAESNTFLHVLNAPSAKRFGYLIPGGANASASGLLTLPSGGGTQAVAFDSTENIVTTVTPSTTSTGSSGFYYQFSTGGIGCGRRAFSTARAITFKTKMKASTSTGTRLYCGFLDTASTTPSLGDTGIGTTGNGVLVGYSSTDTNWTIYSNSGAGSAATKTLITGPIAKDANWHSIEIIYNGTTDVTVIFDGVSQTISSVLPGSTANQYAIVYIENSTVASRSLSFKYVQVSAF